MRSLLRERPATLTPREIYSHLDRYVIGQERAKRTVAIAAYNHFKRLFHHEREAAPILKKSNVLMIGPTGSGKTHIARNLANLLEVPLAVVDATEYTEAGYYGKDVEVMVAELLFKTGGDIDLTQRGIIFIDEIDKIARRSNGMRNGAGHRDIGGEGVQQALLKMLDGTRMFVPMNITQHWNRHDFVEVDTSNILFICAGTFSDLRPDFEQDPIGFGGKENGRGTSERSARPPVTVKELANYGFLSELLGRLPVMVELEPLSADDLVKILRIPPDSILKEYEQMLALDGVTLQIPTEALHAIAEHALEQKVGARGLRAIMERVMEDILFEAPEKPGSTVRLSADLVREKLARPAPKGTTRA